MRSLPVEETVHVELVLLKGLGGLGGLLDWGLACIVGNDLFGWHGINWLRSVVDVFWHFLFGGPRFPQQFPKCLSELKPILKLDYRFELVEIVIDRPLDRSTHLHDLPDMRLDMALGEHHGLHPLFVVLLDELQFVDYGDDLCELEGSYLFEVGEVLGIYLRVVEVRALVEIGGFGLHELDDEGAVVAVSQAADLARCVQGLTQSLPLSQLILILALSQLLESLLDEKRNEVQR